MLVSLLTSLCHNLFVQNCTESWSHPIINTYRSSLGSLDHPVDVRPPPPHLTSLSLWGFPGKAAYRSKKKADRKADRWILSDMTDWLTDSVALWWLADWLVAWLLLWHTGWQESLVIIHYSILLFSKILKTPGQNKRFYCQQVPQ